MWDSTAVRRGAEVDLWVLEPDGGLFIPYLGVVSPNGHLSNDSYATGMSFEGYLTNRFVQRGRYKFFAELYADPANYRPAYDMAYRNGQTSQFRSLYAPNYPRLSLQTSWANDPQASFSRVEAGAYTDLQYAAYVDIGVAAMTADVAAPAAMMAPSAGSMAAGRLAPDAEPRITREQLETVRKARQKAREGSIRPDARSAVRSPAGLRLVVQP